jgi:hypothetical protein
MGYQAPSPEEVYRYALRLDGTRSLTDRFGFSIVFVNDTSPVCREFLREHCVDLCLRTADRIRFVFFSELPDEEFEHIADDMRMGRVRGMLRSVLDLLGFDRPADFERDPWRFLRPRAFRPLRTVDEISERLSWECDLRTAMPGAGMAMEFAQRLGIGRHVPCILVFTEIGDLHVDLLPIMGLTVDRIYQHLRTWIDEFYEQNRTLIDDWNTVEGEITALISKANTNLSEIEDWRNKRVRDWEALSRLSSVIHAAEQGDVKQFEALADRLRYSSSLPPTTSSLLHGLLHAIKDADASSGKAAALRQLAAALAAASNSVDVLAALTNAHTRARGLGEELSGVPDYTKALALRLEQPQTPRGFVELWWRTANRQKLSLKLFKAERGRWERAFGLGKSGIYRDELEIIWKALEDLPLVGNAAEASTAVLRQYAMHLRIDPDSDAWKAESEHYRSVLQHFLNRLCSTAPAWLRDRQPPLTIGETFPRPRDLGIRSAEQMLRERPSLQAAIDEAALTANDAVRDDIAQTTAIAHSYRDEVRAVLEARATSHDVPMAWGPALLADALAELRAARRRLELATLSATKENAPRGSEWNDELARRLHRALDTYADVARSFRYPHRGDPMLRRVPLDMPMSDAAGIGMRHDRHHADLKGSLDDAAASAASLPAIRQEADAAAHEALPSARLARALHAAVAADRLPALLQPFSAEASDAAIDLVVSERRTADLLRRLTHAEQEGIARALTESSSEKPHAANPVDQALMALGLYTATTADVAAGDAAHALQEKILADDFDVFMAHNSADKPAVIELGRRLRAAGVYPWIDVEQIPPGRWFQDVIQAVIPRVRAAAIFIGRSGMGRWQALEIRTFITACVERGLPVIPVLLPGASEIWPDVLFLRELNYVQFVGGLDDEHALGRLVWGITGAKPSVDAAAVTARPGTASP